VLNDSGFSQHRASAELDELRGVAYESGDGMFESQGSLDSQSRRAFAVSFAGFPALLHSPSNQLILTRAQLLRRKTLANSRWATQHRG
jgi:hypothetical protein